MGEVLVLDSIDGFKLFFEDNYQAACLVSMRYVSDAAEAEDIVQNVFITLWHRRTTIQLNSSLKNYLFSAIKKASIKNAQRKKTNIFKLDEAMIIEDRPDHDHYSMEELAVEISRAIQKLPPKCQRVFNLAYHDKLTYEQIAAELNISVNTVKTQIIKAYKRLRVELSGFVFNFFFMSIKKS